MAFLMYGVAGRSWVAMGDPVGPDAEATELAWRFLELADRHHGQACFYQVGAGALPDLSSRRTGPDPTDILGVLSTKCH